MKKPLKVKVLRFDSKFEENFNEFSKEGIEVAKVEFKKDGKYLNYAFVWYKEGESREQEI